MALAMEFTIGNTRVQIMDDFCSGPDQAERDAAIKKKIYADALTAIRANPERYYEVLARKEKGHTDEEKNTSEGDSPLSKGNATA